MSNSTSSYGNISPIEVKTLVHEVDGTYFTAVADQELADVMNEGWEVIDFRVNSVMVRDHDLQHIRIVTLARETDGDEKAKQNTAPQIAPDPTAPPPGDGLRPFDRNLFSGEPVDDFRLNHLEWGDDFEIDPEDVKGMIPVEVEPILSAKPPTLVAAILSRDYTPQQIRDIAEREAQDAGLQALTFAHQENPRTGQAWDSLLCQLYRPEQGL